MTYYHYAPDEYIIVGKDNIDKVYNIIQYLPLDTQMKIIFGWLASEGNKSEWLYERFDFDESLSVYVDLVKEILTQDAPDYGYDHILEELDELRNKKDEQNVSD